MLEETGVALPSTSSHAQPGMQARAEGRDSNQSSGFKLTHTNKSMVHVMLLNTSNACKVDPLLSSSSADFSCLDMLRLGNYPLVKVQLSCLTLGRNEK